MKIDLHVHASERSGCASSGEESMIRAAIDRGLSGMAFTDHGTLVPAERLTELREKFAPFKIYTGIEVNADEEDLLVLGVHAPELEVNPWNYMKLRRFVTQRGGFLVLAHPCRYHLSIGPALLVDPPDAHEVDSVNMVDCPAQLVHELTSRLGSLPMKNSDAHAADAVGRFYNRFEHLPADDADLVGMLKAGQFRPCEGSECEARR